MTINDAKSEVDLAFVSQLGRLEELEIVGSRVVNSDFLRNCPKLRGLCYSGPTFKDKAALAELRSRGVRCEDKVRRNPAFAIRNAIWHAATADVKNLIECGININDLWDAYWSCFALNPDTGFVWQMLENGADVDRGAYLSKLAANHDDDGMTNRVAAMIVLLTHGANLKGTAKLDMVLQRMLNKRTRDGGFVNLLLPSGKTILEEFVSGELDDQRIKIARVLPAYCGEIKSKTLLDHMRRWKSGADKFCLVMELVEKGVDITDKSIGASWPDVDIRHVLLNKVGKHELDYEHRFQHDYL